MGETETRVEATFYTLFKNNLFLYNEKVLPIFKIKCKINKGQHVLKIV